jgi:hypothetical protein
MGRGLGGGHVRLWQRLRNPRDTHSKREFSGPGRIGCRNLRWILLAGNMPRPGDQYRRHKHQRVLKYVGRWFNALAGDPLKVSGGTVHAHRSWEGAGIGERARWGELSREGLDQCTLWHKLRGKRIESVIQFYRLDRWHF